MVKRITKYAFIITFVVIVLFALFVFGLFIFPSKVKFDIEKIKYSNVSVNVLDNNNCLLHNTTTNGMYIKLNTLNKRTKDAFISIEDKSFYSHHGINYKRILGATIKNLTSFSLKQGASTISQQLIKNTHLTNEKTFSRKINEIKLTKELEKKLSKDEILEYYLNIIYFGDNCYGIESASNHYFSKSAKELNLSECAMLAGMIKSPNAYNPIRNPQKARLRRNLVLDEMLSDKKISFDEYNTAKNNDVNVCITNLPSNLLNTYKNACICEACDILKMPQKQIAIGGYCIYSYFDKEKQENLENCFSAYASNDCDYSGISISNDGKIEAYYANSNIELINVKRQPGSTIKPVLVYSPAVNENIISPITQIKDEKIDINGYSPSNVNSKYYGYISARDCLAKSLNVPAVKILGYTGIDKSKDYATKCGIEFDSNDNNLGIALGGMTYGVSLKNLTGAYSIFCNNGEYIEPKFVNYITDKNGKIIYRNITKSTSVIRDDTAYLVTDMLKECAQNGTGRKLGDLKFDVATKTGTVGKKFNTDAYNISYTTKDIVGVWIGNIENNPIDTVGSGIPTDIVKLYLQKIYTNSSPAKFKQPSSVFCERIDMLSLNNDHVVYKANNFIPEKYIKEEIFSKFNPPKDKSTNFISLSPPVLCGKIENKKAELWFEANDYLIYEIYKTDGENDTLLAVVANKNGKCTQSFDINQRTSYFVVTKIKNYADNTEVISDKSNVIELLPNKNVSNYSKWYY